MWWSTNWTCKVVLLLILVVETSATFRTHTYTGSRRSSGDRRSSRESRRSSHGHRRSRASRFPVVRRVGTRGPASGSPGPGIVVDSRPVESSPGTNYPTDWDYSSTSNGPAGWPLKFSSCSGTRQSPINIRTTSVCPASLPTISFINYLSARTTFTVSYTNAAVTLTPSRKIYLRGLGRSWETHILANFHFHWSSVSLRGSEHAINGFFYPLEMHMVTYNSKYGSEQEATRRQDGLAVASVFFNIGKTNSVIARILGASVRLRSADDKVDIQNLNVKWLFPSRTNQYFRYFGGLTTPPCSESVRWTVFENVQTLSYRQFQVFQSLRNGPLSSQRQETHNERPLQALNGRTVYASR